MAKTTVVQLEQLVREQAATISALTERVTALESRRASSPSISRQVASLTQPVVLGKRGEKAACGVIVDGKSHGVVTLNNFGECPRCFCQRMQVESAIRRERRAGRTPVAA